MGVFRLEQLHEDAVGEEPQYASRSDYDKFDYTAHPRHEPRRTSFLLNFLTATDMNSFNAAREAAGMKEDDPACPWHNIGETCRHFDCSSKKFGPSKCVKDPEHDGAAYCFCAPKFCPVKKGDSWHCDPMECVEGEQKLQNMEEKLQQEIAQTRQDLHMSEEEQTRQMQFAMVDTSLILGVHTPVHLGKDDIAALEKYFNVDYDAHHLPGDGKFHSTMKVEDLIKKLKGTATTGGVNGGEELSGGPNHVPLSEAVATLANEAGSSDKALGGLVKQYSGAVAELMEATYNNLNTDKIAMATPEDVPGILTPMVNMLTQVLRSGAFVRHKLAALSEASEMLDQRATARGRARLKMGDSEAVIKDEEEDAEAQREDEERHQEELHSVNQMGTGEPYHPEPELDANTARMLYMQADQRMHPKLVPRGQMQVAPDDMRLAYNKQVRKIMNARAGRFNRLAHGYERGASNPVAQVQSQLARNMGWTPDQRDRILRTAKANPQNAAVIAKLLSAGPSGDMGMDIPGSMGGVLSSPYDFSGEVRQRLPSPTRVVSDMAEEVTGRLSGISRRPSMEEFMEREEAERQSQITLEQSQRQESPLQNGLGPLVPSLYGEESVVSDPLSTGLPLRQDSADITLEGSLLHGGVSDPGVAESVVKSFVPTDAALRRWKSRCQWCYLMSSKERQRSTRRTHHWRRRHSSSHSLVVNFL